jgi:mRNA interferase MazF
LLLTRDEVVDSLNEIIVAPLTRTVRGLKTEVVLTPADGTPVVSAINFDHVAALGTRRWLRTHWDFFPDSAEGLDAASRTKPGEDQRRGRASQPRNPASQ